MHKQNAPETTALLTSCPANAAGYLSNADRFHTDTAGDEYEARLEQKRKQEAAKDFRRNMVGKRFFFNQRELSLINDIHVFQQASKREEDRWTEAERKQKAEEEYWAKLREDGSKAKKNTSNMAYDILTLQYAADEDGEAQKYHDDMGKYFIIFKLNTKSPQTNFYLLLIAIHSAISR